MPFLRDEGPPIPPASIQRLRESLPVDHGWQIVNETGREVLAVRVPKAKPDYLHDLADVAFYVGLETIRNTKDILLIGHEKTARLEPQLLRDHIRSQAREDITVVEHLRRQLDRQYGHTFVQSPSNHQHNAFAVRIPKETVAQFTPEDVAAIRQLVATLRARVMDSQYAYVVANADHERLGRRTLLELIGDAAASAPAEPAAPEPVAAPAESAPLPQTQSPFPATPIAAAPPAQPVAAAPTPAPVNPALASSPFAGLAAAPTAPPARPAAAPPAAPAPVHPALAGTPFAALAAAAATPPAAPAAAAATPSPARPAGDIQVEDEYEIVSKPKAPPAASPAAAAAPATVGLEGATHVDDEYEIVSKPKAPPAAAPSPAEPTPSAEDAPARTMLREEKEYEVFVSKPKPRPDTPAITPPGQGGFQAALHANGPAPSRTKEYEIMGHTSVTSDPSIASRMKLPSATPAPSAPLAPQAPPVQAPPPTHVPFPPTLAAAAAAAVPVPVQPAAAPPAPEPAPSVYDPVMAIPPRVPTPTLPVADSGAAMVTRVAPAAPELILAQRFKEAGYEIVEGLRAQGTTFAFAAHRPNGRRVLVKRAATFSPEDASTLAQLVAALGADVALVVADEVKAGTRLATWGTRIEVVTPTDVPSLGF